MRETALGAIPKARHYSDRDALVPELARIGPDLERSTRIAELHGLGRVHLILVREE